jgi:hypothetical protein
MSSIEFLTISGGSSTNTNTFTLYEFAYGDATNKTTIINAYPVGGVFSEHARSFPVFVPHGFNLYWRVKSFVASLVVNISCQLLPMSEPFGNNIRPFSGCFASGIDVNTTLGAKSVPGSTGAWGAVTSIGTTTQDVHAFKLIPFLAVGLVNPASAMWARALINTTIEIDRIRFDTSTNEWIQAAHNLMPKVGYIPNGTAIDCQAWTNTAGAQSMAYSLLCFYK